MPNFVSASVPATALSIKIAPVSNPSSPPSVDVTARLDLSSLSIEESGNHGTAHMDWRWRDTKAAGLLYAQLRGPNRVLCTDSSGNTLFRGYLTDPNTTVVGGFEGMKDVSAKDVGSLFDSTFMPTTFKLNAANGGTNFKGRLAFLLSAYWPKGEWPIDWTGANVQQLDTNLDDQTIQAGITLREAFEQVCSNASDSFKYFLTPGGTLYVYDDDNPLSFPAPFTVVAKVAPAGGETNVMEPSFSWNLGSLHTFYVVLAAKPAYNLALGDNDQIPQALWGGAADSYTGHLVLPGPSGYNLWGNFQAMINAPHADSLVKSLRVLRAALRDTRNPVPSGRFSIEGTNAVGWHGGQQVYVASAVHGLNGSGTDAGPWAGLRALQPFTSARVTTTFTHGGTVPKVDIEVGSRVRNLYQG